MCPFGYFCPEGSLNFTTNPCPPQTLCPPGTGSLGACFPGHVFNGSTCNPCHPGQHAGYGDRNCSKCKTGRYSPSAGSSKCNECPPGRFGDSLHPQISILYCSPCRPGAYSASWGVESSMCNECPPGRNSSVVGATSLAACAKCLPSTFAQQSGQTACDMCTTGTSERGSAYCSACKAGKVLDPALMACVPCKSGTISASGDHTCTRCNPGFFVSAYGTECTPCPGGTWSAVAGATGIEACNPCTRGKFSSTIGLDDKSKCNECPPGTKGTSLGAVSFKTCTDCAEGRISKNSGQTACEACTAGSSEAGSSYCTDCAAGTALDTSKDPPACVLCPQGTVSATGDESCSACKPGRFADATRISCTLCAEGTWSNITRATSSAACNQCTRGKYSQAQGLDAAAKCNACPPGKHGVIVGASSPDACVDCHAGRFSGTGGQTTCAQCVTGTSPAGSSFCTDCRAGTELVNGRCQGCVAGKSSATGGRCWMCEEGRFAASDGADTCKRCPDFMTSRHSNATVCVAARGYVLGMVWNSDKDLHSCPESGARCNDKPGAVVEFLELEPGHWRPTYTSLDIRPCGDGCAGGTSTGREGQGVCSNTTTGPYCGVCAKAFKRHGGECVSCKELGVAAATPLLVLLGVLMLIVALGVLFRKRWSNNSIVEKAEGAMLVGMTDTSEEGGYGRVAEKFKIAYAFAQVVSSIFEEFDIKFPPWFSALASAFSVVNLDVFGFLSMGCIVDVNFYGELTTTCAVPIFLAVFFLAHAWYQAKKQETKHKVRQIFTKHYLVVLFCVFSGVTRKIFTTFKCEHFVTAGLNQAGCVDEGHAWLSGTCYRSYLRADLSLSCDADAHTGWSSFAVSMALLYPFGVTFLFAWLLFRHTDDTSLSFIRAAYKDTFYWWEIVELGRKLLLTLILVFFYEGTSTQILLTLIVTLFFFAFLRSYKPYKSEDDDFLAAYAQMLLILTSLASLCLKVDVATEDAWNAGWFDFFLAALVVSVPVLAAFEVLLVAENWQNHSLLCTRWCRRACLPNNVAPSATVAPVAESTSMVQLHEKCDVATWTQDDKVVALPSVVSMRNSGLACGTHDPPTLTVVDDASSTTTKEENTRNPMHTVICSSFDNDGDLLCTPSVAIDHPIKQVEEYHESASPKAQRADVVLPANIMTQSEEIEDTPTSSKIDQGKRRKHHHHKHHHHRCKNTHSHGAHSVPGPLS